jgi:hypothetical protein
MVDVATVVVESVCAIPLRPLREFMAAREIPGTAKRIVEITNKDFFIFGCSYSNKRRLITDHSNSGAYANTHIYMGCILSG